MKDSKLLSGTPRSHGFRMPAQWEQHISTVMAWPFHETDQWMLPIDEIRDKYFNLLKAISASSPVLLLVRQQDLISLPKSLHDISGITVQPCALDDVWTRDFGPIILKKGTERAAVIWEFSGWGGKWSCDADSTAWRSILPAFDSPPFFKGPLRLEGGAVDVDGLGRGITTRSCLLSETRNSNLSEREVANIVKDYYGLDRLIWLDQGFVGNDHTDGHVDMVARFTPSGAVVVNWVDDVNHPSYGSFLKNYQELVRATSEWGGRVERLNLPKGKFIANNWGGGSIEAPANYCNFYINNGTVIVPQFFDPHDDLAVEILGRCFPGYKIVMVPGGDIVRGGGGLFNCLTQQVP